jgi:hypothetical protein
MTLPSELLYFSTVVAQVELDEGNARDAWDVARLRFVSGEILFNVYLAAYRLYRATSLEADMLRVNYTFAMEKGDEARKETDKRAAALAPPPNRHSR